MSLKIVEKRPRLNPQHPSSKNYSDKLHIGETELPPTSKLETIGMVIKHIIDKKKFAKNMLSEGRY